MLRKQKPSDRLVEIFLELVKIDGISYRELDVNDYLIKFLRKLGLNPFVDNAGEKVGSNTGNIICNIGNGGDFVVISHMDTAASTINIKPQLLEDRITSDGKTILGADNRAGIALILYNLEQLLYNKEKIKNFTLCFTICEEHNIEGSKYLQLPSSIKRGFVIDSSLRPGKFIHTTYGAKGLDIKITGRASHAGLHPEDGISSIFTASQAISKLKLGRVNEYTTSNFGLINGGEAINIIPKETHIIGEVRSKNIEEIEKIINEYKSQFELACKQNGATLEFSSHWDFHPYYIDEESKVFQTIFNIIKNIGLKPEPMLSAGGSDANSLNKKGIKTVNIGIGAQNPHSYDEFILLEDLKAASDIVCEIIKG